MIFLGHTAGPSFAQWHLLCSSDPAQPLHPSFLGCCALWDTSAPPWWMGIPAPAPRPPLQAGSHNQTHSFTTTTPRIKVLPAPSALPQWIREMQLQTLAAALFFPRGDGALLGALGFPGRLPFNMLHLADRCWHPSPSVLVGLWRQALGCPSSPGLPRASRRAACYSLLIFQHGKTSWGSLPSAFGCSEAAPASHEH